MDMDQLEDGYVIVCPRPINDRTAAYLCLFSHLCTMFKHLISALARNSICPSIFGFHLILLLLLLLILVPADLLLLIQVLSPNLRLSTSATPEP